MAIFSKGGLLGGLLGGGDAETGKADARPDTPSPHGSSEEPVLRAMTMEDLPVVLDIIEEHDEDDAEEAEASLTARQCEGVAVAEVDGEVVGLTGAVADETVPDIRWLSWTYVRKDARGKGVGQFMMDALLDHLGNEGVRKLFISTSDYKEDGEDVYAPARAFYEQLGAREELRIPHYHDTDESKIIYGLENPSFKGGAPLEAESDGLRFTGFEEAPESEDGYGLTWTEDGAGISGLEEQIAAAQKEDARALFVELPDDLSRLATDSLTRAGFREVGALTDYYGVGVRQVHWARILD